MVSCLNSYALTTLEQCNNFRVTILDKAIFEDLKSLNDSIDDHNYRFVKNEEEALRFILSFDAKKIGYDLNAEAQKKELQACESRKIAPFCENSFPVYNFLRALIYGVRNYNWSPTTKDKAIQKAWSFISEVQDKKPSLFDVTLAFSILGMMNFDNIMDPKMNQRVKTLGQEIEAQNLKLKELLKTKKPSENCLNYADVREEETKIKNHFASELGLLLKSR